MTSDERPDDVPGAEPRPSVDRAPAAGGDPRGAVPGGAGPDDGAADVAGAGTQANAPAAERGGAAGAASSDPPDADALAAVATPATIRRAPKVSAFITAGALLGLVVGWILASVATGTTGEARTAVVLVTTVAAAVLGGLVGGGLATVADRRSTRR